MRSFELILESVSHDWHVQPSCQRPNRGPPKRCEFSPGKFAVGGLKAAPYANPTVLETLQAYGACYIPSIIASHRISRCFPHREKRSGSERGRAASDSRFLRIKPFGMTRLGVRILGQGALTRATVWPSGRINATFGACRSEDRKLRKDPFGGPCFEGTLRKPCCFSE